MSSRDPKLFAGSLELFADSLGTFEALVKSYSFMGENIPPTNEELKTAKPFLPALKTAAQEKQHATKVIPSTPAPADDRTVGKDIQKVDLVPIVYQEARKDFDRGVIYMFDLEISFGDLSGDGNEEAVVKLFCRGAPMSSGGWHNFYLYALRDGKPTLIYKGQSGDRAHGGICEAYMCSPDSILECVGHPGDRRLVVRRYKPDKTDCNACYGFVEETQYELHGDDLVVAKTKTTPLDKLDATDPCAIRVR